VHFEHDTKRGSTFFDERLYDLPVEIPELKHGLLGSLSKKFAQTYNRRKINNEDRFPRP
jgi:hypothetical protein